MREGSLSKNETDVQIPLRKANVDALGITVVRHLVLHPADLGEKAELGREMHRASAEHADIPAQAGAGSGGHIGSENVEGQPDRNAEPQLEVGRFRRDREATSNVEVGIDVVAAA